MLDRLGHATTPPSRATIIDELDLVLTDAHARRDDGYAYGAVLCAHRGLDAGMT